MLPKWQFSRPYLKINIDFTYNLSGKKIIKFPHCVINAIMQLQIIHEFSKSFDKSRFSISGHNDDSRHWNIMFRRLLIYFNHKNQLHLHEKSVLPYVTFFYFSNVYENSVRCWESEQFFQNCRGSKYQF